jgi:UDP-glucose 4-epimerase
MKILVTGGAGFIGSHVCDALMESGHSVHVLDNLSGSTRSGVPAEANFHELDIRDPHVHELWADERFEVLYHLAAQMDVRKSVADPAFDADVNIRGMLNVIEAGRSNGLRKIVFSSTGGAIYGEPDYTPQDESHVLQPLSPYGITKLCSEKYLHFYRETHGIEYVALRYGNVYGPRQNPHGEAGVVAIFSERLLDSIQPTINGDGLQTRDYVFVSDVVDANLRALSFEGSGIFNIGTGKETTVVELYSVLRDELAPEMPIQHGPGMPGEQRRSVLAYSHALSVLGWQPSVGIQSGLTQTARWFRDQHVKS